MRRAAAPPPLHQLSAAVATATVDSSATMPSRPPYRGGRYGRERGFSSERTSPHSGGRGQFVTGDSHFQSVRESNLGFRQGEKGSSVNNAGSYSAPQNPRPPSFGGNHQFRSVRESNIGFRQGEKGSFANNAGSYSAPQNPRPPSFGGNHQFRRAPPPTQGYPYRGPHPFTHNQQPPPFHPNQGVRTPQQFRSRPPKPLDYRHWDYASTPPPSTCERFTILSYNILADYLAMDHKQKLYHHIPHYMLDWEWRKNNILFELGLWSTDIMCFQEVDRFHDLEEALKVRGFRGIWKMRTGVPVDGCAIFWRVSRFKLLHEEYIEFNKLGLRDNVAQICVLERNPDNADNSVTPPTSTSNLNKVVICNIHVLFNPRRGEIKLGQVRALLEKAHAISKIWNNAPIVLCGDFNCTPKSALYNFISEQKLDLSGLDRDKVSGQSSAEIHQPSPLYLNPRLQTVNGSVPLQLRLESRNIERKLDSSLSDIQKQNCPLSRMENENLPPVNPSLAPDSSYSVFDASDNSCNNLELGMKGITLHSESQKESQDGALFDHKNLGETTCCEKTISFNVDHTSEKVCEVGTDPKELHPIATEKQPMEEVDTSRFNHKSSRDGFDMGQTFDKESKNSVDSTILDDAKFDSQTDILDTKDVPLTPACQNSMADAARDIEDVPSMSLLRNDSAVVERPKVLSSDEQDVATVDGSLTEDDSTFLAALHGGEELLPVMNTETFEVENITHDRSFWTPMEIETATGNADCTLIEHPLKLRSTYTEAEDSSGTRDLNGEPLVTSYNRCFLGTVDYIWRSEGLQTVRVLAPIKKEVMQQLTSGFPTKKWGSDHIALATELAFIRSHED